MNRQTLQNTISSYQYAPEAPAVHDIKVRINGILQTVLTTPSSLFVCAAWNGENGEVEVEIECETLISICNVRPRSRRIEAHIENNIARFTLENPQNLSIEIAGMKPLFLFASELQNVPSRDNEKTHFFAAGKIHEVGELFLRDGETLYLEGGAIVRGNIHAINARDITICGNGVLDGAVLTRDCREFSAVLEGCEKVSVRDITMIEPSTWMLVLGNCRHVEIENLHQIGEVVSSDGIDVVGSRDIQIRNCFLRNNDDCVVIKAVDFSQRPNDKGVWRASSVHLDWRANVENVLVENCVFVNDRAGNAIEIGYETRCDSIENITFRNCDILSVHGYGAAFAIHNGDRALIQNIHYEDIRVEHFYDKLIDFRVLDSRYRHDETLGQIRNVNFKNIRVHVDGCNIGYSHSLIGGFDAQHTIENVVIEDFYLNEQKATSADALDLYLKHAHHIEFR